MTTSITALAATAAASNTTPPSALDTNNSSSEPPSLPDRPNTLQSVVNQTAANYSSYGQNRLVPHTGIYGGYGGDGYYSYSSPSSQLGGMRSLYRREHDGVCGG